MESDINSPQIFIREGDDRSVAEEIFVYNGWRGAREDAKGPVINFTFAAWLAVRATAALDGR